MDSSTIEQNSLLIRQAAKLHRRNAGIIGFLKGFIMTACLIGIYPLTIWIVISQGNLFGPTPTYFGPIIILFMYLAYFIIPFLVCAPIALLLSQHQKQAARILVFRKFNNKVSRKALSNIIHTGLSKYGHTFTLADTNFKVPWYVRIPFFQGQLSLFHFRQIMINTKKRLEAFKASIKQESWLNINWLLSADKIFAVRSSDECWQQTAGILLASSDIILFDVSLESTYMAWEMEQSIKHKLGNKIIAVCSTKKKTAVEAWIANFKDAFETPVPLFFYNDKGELTDKQAFDDAVVKRLALSYQQEKTGEGEEWLMEEENKEQQVLSAEPALAPALQSAGTGQPASPVQTGNYAVRRTIKLFAVMAVCILIIFFFISPWFAPGVTIAYTPFPGQAVTAFIQYAKITKDKERIYSVGKSIHRSWPVTAAAKSIDHALSHYKDECVPAVYALECLGDISQYKQYMQLVNEAEPSIAAAAARVLGTLHPADGSKLHFAMQLFKSPCLNSRLNAIEILHTEPLTAAIADTILSSVIIPPVYEKLDTHRTIVVSVKTTAIKQAPVDIQNENDYYLQLFQLLKPTILPRHQPQLQLLYNSQHPGARIFAGLLLAQFNDARPVPVLIEALALKQTAHVLFFIPVNSFPFEPEIDSLLHKLNKPQYMPPVDSFVARLNYPTVLALADRSKKNHSLKKMLVFVSQHYSLEESLQVYNKLTPDCALQFVAALDSLNETADAEMKKRLLAYARAGQQLLQKNLETEWLSTQIASAWWLARIGNASLVKAVVHIADIYPLREILDKQKTYPHTGEAKEIMELLYTNLQTGCNSEAWKLLQEKARPELQPVLAKLIRKCKGK